MITVSSATALFVIAALQSIEQFVDSRASTFIDAAGLSVLPPIQARTHQVIE
jgi:hypothetical protein